MKNGFRIASMIALSTTALAGVASPSIASQHAHLGTSARKSVAIEHKKAPKKILISFERATKVRKSHKNSKKAGRMNPVISGDNRA